MKRQIRVGVAVGAGVLAYGVLALVGSDSEAAISGSKHDFSGEAWSGGQICLPCHAPHNNKNGANEVLWNHAASTATYQFYTGFKMDAAAPTAMSSSSKDCMSCHDGTVALDSFGTATGTHFAPGGSNMGVDLRNDHPISISYNTALANTDGTLHDPASTASGLAGGGMIEDDMTFAGKIECSSCHDVHNQFNVPGMLKKSNDGSALCMTCHDK